MTPIEEAAGRVRAVLDAYEAARNVDPDLIYSIHGMALTVSDLRLLVDGASTSQKGD